MNYKYYTLLPKKTGLFLCFLFLSHFTILFAQPDLIVVESALQNSFQVQTLNSNDQCYLNEGCVNGLGQRDIIRFTTHIRNIGNQDFYVGAPPGNPALENEVWEYDECHGHWHYEGYAEYKLFDEDDNEIPIGFKNGFCLIDVECSGGGNFTYTCSNQGISAGCGDIYSSGLDCQWIDITDVPDGRYKMVIRVNWDQDPDANGNYETSYTNNSGSICFDLMRMNGEVSTSIVGNGCTENTNCTDVTLGITLDNYPEETSWEIRDASNTAVATGGTYGSQPDGSTITEVICLPDGCYDFVINDVYGDGICCSYGNGSYQLTDDSGNILASGGQFTNSETTNFCISTTPPPCTDADNDGICAVDDCDDNNNMVPAPPGASCDDGNPDTDHDEIGPDGCTCEGTPIGTHDDCDDILVAANGSYITVNGIDVFSHVNIQVFNSNWTLVDNCVDDCGTTYGYGPTADGVYFVSVKTFDANWTYECDILVDITVAAGPCTDNDNDGVCEPDDCDDNNPNLPATVGSACNDGDANTVNDQIQADGCTCAGTPSTGCTDNDNDGVCEQDDCDDNNPNLPAAVGSVCDDGNANTMNDQIQADGCTCAGTPDMGCTDNDNDGVCEQDDCDDNNPNLPAAVGSSCDDGDANTTDDQIQSDGCTCAGTPVSTGTCDDIIISTGPSSISISQLNFPNINIQVFTSSWSNYFTCVNTCDDPLILTNVPEGGYIVSVKTFDEQWITVCDLLVNVTVSGGPCTDNDNDGVCEQVDCDDNNPNLPTTVGSACDDGDANTLNDQIQSDGCTCAGTPDTGCTDNDNDGVCEQDDCDDNNPNLPAAVGSSCDDGDANTINDQIQSDGCTCAGTPDVGSGTCDAIEIVTTPSTITINGLNFPHLNIQVFTASWTGYFSCVDNCGNPMILNNVPSGDYIVSVKTFNEQWQDECDILETVTVSGGGGCTDNDNDGICAANDCDDDNPYIPAAPGSTCNDGDATTANDEIQGDGCTCAGTPIDESCDLAYVTGNGSVTISGLNTAHVNLKLFDASFNTVYACVDDCTNPLVIDNLPGGTYYLDVQLFDEVWGSVCSISEYIDVSNGQGLVSNAGLEYLYFTAVKAGEDVNLHWVTNTDYRNSHFLIERSADGFNFELLRQIPSQLLGSNASSYQRRDDQPKDGMNYYRIKEVFGDGTFRYSVIREIEMTAELKHYNIFPNPTTGNVSIDLIAYSGKRAKIMLSNNLGQIVYRQDFERLDKGLIEMNFKGVPAGVYFIFIAIEGQKPIGEKLVITRL